MYYNFLICNFIILSNIIFCSRLLNLVTCRYNYEEHNLTSGQRHVVGVCASVILRREEVRIKSLVAVFWKNWPNIEISRGLGKKPVQTQIKLFQDEESDQCLH